MSKTKVKFLGHTTVLVQTGYVNFIFDPNFSHKLRWLKRKTKPFIPFEDLHNVHAILISNARRHRFDLDSMRYFKQASQIILPLGLARRFDKSFAFHLIELKPGAQTNVSDCRVTAIKALAPAATRRGGLNYLVKTPMYTIFYATDTAYQGAYFHKIGRDFKITLAILPIDHVGFDFCASKRYMNPAQALHAFQDLGADKMLPVCYGAFHLSRRSPDKFLKEFENEVASQGLTNKVVVLRPGDEIKL